MEHTIEAETLTVNAERQSTGGKRGLFARLESLGRASTA